MWYLNPALTRFRNAVNAAYPNRDKTSDGTIGDENHQAGISDHNPDLDGSVDAWDMDVDGVPVEDLKVVFQAHESSQYWIHNRQIATRGNGWKRVPYSGANPHDKHVHWNTRTSHENSTAPWEVGVTPEDIAKIAQASARAVHNQKLGSSDVTIGQAVQRTDVGVVKLQQTPIDPDALAAAMVAALQDPAVLAAVGKLVSPWSEHTHVTGPAVPGD
jgi:hypothetical protein